MANWSPNLTRGLWGLVQGAVRDGFRLADVRSAAASAGEAPDAATLSHLYSRAVGGEAMIRSEADYRGRVDPDTYLARRPTGGHIAPLPRGFSLAGKYRQVVQVSGTSTLTGQPTSAYVNVQFDRLLSRGEAIELALGAVAGDPGRYGLENIEGTYHATWSRG
jgi:hypothetical protein